MHGQGQKGHQRQPSLMQTEFLCQSPAVKPSANTANPKAHPGQHQTGKEKQFHLPSFLKQFEDYVSDSA